MGSKHQKTRFLNKTLSDSPASDGIFRTSFRTNNEGCTRVRYTPTNLDSNPDEECMW